MRIKLIGGNAEGQVLEVPDGTTAWEIYGGDGVATRYVSHYAFEFGNPRGDRPMDKEAFFAPASMSQDEVLLRAKDLFDDPDED